MQQQQRITHVQQVVVTTALKHDAHVPTHIQKLSRVAEA
jgi:hypothetical protein